MPLGAAVQSRLGASVLDLTVDDRSFNKGIQGVVNQTKHVHKAFDAAGVKSEKLSGRVHGLSKAMKLFGGVTGGIALIALTKWTEAMVNNVVEMKVLASTAGLTTRAMQEYGYAARQAGLSMSGLIDTSKELQLRIDEFVETGYGPARESFLRLGFSAEHFRNELHRTDDAMNSLIEAIARVDSQEARLRLADEIFGGTGGEQVERFVRYMHDTGLTFQQIRQRAHDLGIVLSDDLVDNTREIHAAFLELKDVIGTSFARALLNVLPPMDEIDQFLKTRLPNAINGLFSRLDEFVDRVEKLNLTWGDFARIIGQVLTALAALKGFAIGSAIGATLTPVLGPLAPLIGGAAGAAGLGFGTAKMFQGVTGVDIIPPGTYETMAQIHTFLNELKNLVAQPHKWMQDNSFESIFQRWADEARARTTPTEELNKQSDVKAGGAFLPEQREIPAGYKVADLYLRAHAIELELRKLQRLGQPPEIPIPGVAQTTRAEREFKARFDIELKDVPTEWLSRFNEDIGFIRRGDNFQFDALEAALPYAPTTFPQPQAPVYQQPQPLGPEWMADQAYWSAQHFLARPGFESAGEALGDTGNIIGEAMATGGLEEKFSTLEGSVDFVSDAMLALAGDPSKAMEVALVLLADVFKGLWEILGPLVQGVIKPFAQILKIIGKILGATIAPILASMAPILTILANAFKALYNIALKPLANAFIAIANVFIHIANAFGAGLDLIKPLEDVDFGAGQTGTTPEDDEGGERATFRRQRPINVYITFPGNVYAVGEGGFRELAEIITIEQEKSGRVPRV